MPLLFQHTINSQAQLSVWKIEEPADFFANQLQLEAPAVHPLKQLQFLAGRYLLKQMHPDFPLDKIFSAAGEKPFVTDKRFEFSITHTDRFVAAIVSQQHSVGIDMEMISAKAYKVAPRFLHPEEIDLLVGYDTDILNKTATLLWSVKETVYKWRGEKGVDFREQIRIKTIHQNEKRVEGAFLGSPVISFSVLYKELDGAVLSWYS
ncbi:MAG: 4'-phosphopantetheinyl transferase superfamily protein [Bacteroidetes bacterium]|nr:4'-phosphopantetheinyl transferase superfamily protein [Bacteroidota bacterium]